jgi:isopenicillin-N N-acyltransferase-like protein
MFHIQSQGGPFERGVAHGRAAAGKIAWLVDHYRKGFRQADGTWREGLGPESRQRQVAERIEGLQEAYPDGCREIEGIASGSGLPFEDVFELNVVFELGPKMPANACTVYGFVDAEGRPRMGKSDDLWLQELGCNAIDRIKPDRGYASTQLHYVGTIWTSASMNEVGFGFGMTGLTGTVRNPGGMPTLFLLHMVAEQCATVSEAEALMADFEVEAEGMSLIAGDASGDVAVLQKHAAGQTAARPERPGQAVWETNHCKGSLEGADNPCCAFLDNSRDREALVARADARVDRTLAGLEALYRMHGEPVGVCQHGEAGLHTDSGIVLSPTDRTMWATEGYPCRNPFVLHDVGG